jgi:hypothetical protein
MRGKFDGQNLLFIVMLALIVMLSYCSIPHGDNDLDPWEKAKNTHMKSMALHDASPEKGMDHDTVASEPKEIEKSVVEPATKVPAPVPAHTKATVHEEKAPAPAKEKTAHQADVIPEETKKDAHVQAVEETPAIVTANKVAHEEIAPSTTVVTAPAAQSASGGMADIMVMENSEYASIKNPSYCLPIKNTWKIMPLDVVIVTMTIPVSP